MKQLLKRRFPKLVQLSRTIRRRRWQHGKLEDKFTWIYEHNFWKSNESISGTGSSLLETLQVRQQLPELFRDLGVQRLLDIPCGDFHWMQEIVADVPSYVGADVVTPLVQRNMEQYGGPGREFVKLDLTQDALPPCDLLFCRDCLVHFSFEDIWQALRNIAATETRYVMLTSFVDLAENTDIPTGAWRKLSLEAAPFALPQPLVRVSEQSGLEDCEDKSLLLWDIQAFRRGVERQLGLQAA